LGREGGKGKEIEREGEGKELDMRGGEGQGRERYA
jgi:hypothetical protein